MFCRWGQSSGGLRESGRNGGLPVRKRKIPIVEDEVLPAIEFSERLTGAGLKATGIALSVS
jgi:hypothetical protein